MNEFVLDSLVVGTVKEIRSYGAIISFPENREGLLHIKEVSDSFIVNLKTYLQENVEIRLRIIEISDTNGFLKLSLKSVPFTERIYFHKEGRSKDVLEDVNFSPLEKALPQWINEAKENISNIENGDEHLND